MIFSFVIAVLLVAFAVGIPVAYSLLIPSVLYLAQQGVPLYVIAQKMANGVESFPLLAVPFFIAAGEMMNTGGVTRRLVNLASTMVGHIAGGLAHVAIVANMIMAGMSGSALADAAGTGRVLIPAMAEVFTGLQTGTVEGQENPFAQILSNKFYEVQKYLILTSHIVQCGSIIFNEKLFQQQPKEYQKALTDSAQEAMDWYLEYLTAQEGKMLEQLKGYGMVAVEPDQAAFREAMRPVYEKYDRIWTKELREKIQSYK